MRIHVDDSQFRAAAYFFKEGVLAATIEAKKQFILWAFSAVTERTPVDRGNARWNWFVGARKAPTDYVFQNRRRKAVRKINPPEVAAWVNLYIANNTPYIELLENRRSKQAPQGIVRPIHSTFGRVMEDLWKRALSEVRI